MINCSNIRKNVIEIATQSNEGHIASSFSIIEILVAIYEYEVTECEKKFDPSSIILSKGHASYGYYGLLISVGMMSDGEKEQIGKKGSKFYGHVPYIEGDKRFEFGSGSLGHGIPYAVGRAYGIEMNRKNKTINCIVGDGEANEGTFWETLLILEKLELCNLNIFIDCNKSSERAIPINNILGKLNGVFKNIEVHEVNGHSVPEIIEVMKKVGKSKLIICNTIKGYPISFMKSNPEWHHKTPNKNEIEKILGELK